MDPYQIVALETALAASVWDLYDRRIPNLLTFGVALLAIVAHGYGSGWPGAGWAAAGWMAGAALFLPVYALGGMGAGDVKLLAAIGAWLGPADALWVGLFSGIAGGVMALAIAVASGYLSRALANIVCLLRTWRTGGIRPLPALTLDAHTGPRLPYAVPVLAGLGLTLWLK